MSREYASKEVDGILEQSDQERTLNLSMAAAWILGNLKGINLKVLDMRETTSLSDYFVLASATNMTQAQAMANDISYHFKRHKVNFLSKEGLQGSDWILLDTGDIIIHVFIEASREVYALESLWKEAPSVAIPNEYYSSMDEAPLTLNNDSDKSYF